MNIKFSTDTGSEYDIDLRVLRRIIIAGHQKLDQELADNVDIVKTAEDAEDYNTVLEILEGAYFDGRSIIEAAKEAENLHVWMDSMPPYEQEIL